MSTLDKKVIDQIVERGVTNIISKLVEAGENCSMVALVRREEGGFGIRSTMNQYNSYRLMLDTFHELTLDLLASFQAMLEKEA